MADQKDQKKEDEAGEFKVVDRRQFTAEGEPRAGADTASPPPPSAPKAPETPKPPKAEAPPGPQAKPAPSISEPQPDALGPVKFEHLVMSLVTTAMLQLGLAARPGEAPQPPDLPGAQETIDLLTVLQQKTQGNLSREEEEVLAGSLYELRMLYVELTRAAGQRH